MNAGFFSDRVRIVPSRRVRKMVDVDRFLMLSRLTFTPGFWLELCSWVCCSLKRGIIEMNGRLTLPRMSGRLSFTYRSRKPREKSKNVQWKRSLQASAKPTIVPTSGPRFVNNKARKAIKLTWLAAGLECGELKHAILFVS